MKDSELLFKIAITQVEKVGAVLAKNLISYCGGVEQVFSKSKKDLSKIPGIGLAIADEITKKDVLIKAEHILKENEKKGIKTLFYLDDDYPSRLKNYNDCPVVLYCEGTEALNNPRILGIVGTRNATKRGRVTVESFISYLKEYDITIVSGLAFGIDAYAHEAAIKSKIPNIAVMGSGIGITYPAEHSRMREEIIKNGDVISEFALDTSPEKGHFPMRNRIIAGMSDALLVVESDIKGGAIITANLAFDYNKDVFAVPGRIDDTYSRGTNHLIKSNVASLAESAADICKAMNWNHINEKKPFQLQLFGEINQNESKILELISVSDEKSLKIDELHYLSGFTLSELSGLLLELELKGIIESLPGSRYSVK
ncbi:MAG: DNA-processing protein DprA [Deltaproteobacteria bacterium]